MEASQPVSDDEYSSETQTTISASKDQVEPKSTSEPQNTTKSEFIPREIEFLNRHRGKLRLCDPKGVYEFRHIQQTWLQSLLQLVTMLISLTCMAGLYYLAYQGSKEIMLGVGEVSNLTWIDAFEVIMIVGIIFMAIKRLGERAKLHPQKRYRLTMLANAFNRMWLNNFRLMLIVFLLFIVANLIKDPTLQSINLELFEEGAIADLANAICSLIVIFICFRAFRFCGKELTA